SWRGAAFPRGPASPGRYPVRSGDAGSRSEKHAAFSPVTIAKLPPSTRGSGQPEYNLTPSAPGPFNGNTQIVRRRPCCKVIVGVGYELIRGGTARMAACGGG